MVASILLRLNVPLEVWDITCEQHHNQKYQPPLHTILTLWTCVTTDMDLSEPEARDLVEALKYNKVAKELVLLGQLSHQSRWMTWSNKHQNKQQLVEAKRSAPCARWSRPTLAWILSAFMVNHQTIYKQENENVDHWLSGKQEQHLANKKQKSWAKRLQPTPQLQVWIFAVGTVSWHIIIVVALNVQHCVLFQIWLFLSKMSHSAKGRFKNLIHLELRTAGKHQTGNT